jgi:hypothetical protein
MKDARKSLVGLTNQVELLVRLVHDVTSLVGSSMKDFQRDVETLRTRSSNEGFGFLSKTLPKLGKALDSALETGSLIVPPSFRVRRATKIPVFLRGIFSILFDDYGMLLPGDSIYQVEAVRGLRQILFLFYKQEEGYSSSSESAVIQRFEETEVEISKLTFDSSTDDILWKASVILDCLFEGFDPRDITPRHGPGAVATGEKGNEKYLFKRRYDSLEDVFSFPYFFMVGLGGEYLDRKSWFEGLNRVRKGDSCAKVALVPKDSRGPRLISMEPLEIQWIQQGLAQKIVSWVEHHPLTRGSVNFTDQSINGRLALSSSFDRKFATIDLKDASDRVTVALVKAIFPDDLVDALLAARTDLTALPSGRLVPLSKFAPMGSALCFPIMALTIWALVNAEVLDAPISRSAYHGRCFVYGDDLIVASKRVDSVTSRLEAYGLRVNQDKSFSKGFFRESCGVDAWHGVDVTPYKVKKPLFELHRDASETFSSMCNGINQLWQRGYWRAGDFLREKTEQRFGPVPYGTATTGFPCIQLSCPKTANSLNLANSRIRRRWNASLQRLEFKVKVLIPKPVTQVIDGWCRLLKGLIAPSECDPSVVFPANRKALKSGWRTV